VQGVVSSVVVIVVTKLHYINNIYHFGNLECCLQSVGLDILYKIPAKMPESGQYWLNTGMYRQYRTPANGIGPVLGQYRQITSLFSLWLYWQFGNGPILAQCWHTYSRDHQH
jgi:hypothetical protein